MRMICGQVWITYVNRFTESKRLKVVEKSCVNAMDILQPNVLYSASHTKHIPVGILDLCPRAHSALFSEGQNL